MDSNNHPRVVYGEGVVIYGAVFTNSSNVRYAEWNGQSWSIQTVFLGVSSFEHVVLDSNGYPHFTYLVGASLRYASWDGSTWSTQIVDSNPLISDSSFLALDSHNNPHVSYFKEPELGSGTGGNLMYAYWTGSGWNTETVDNNGTDYGAGPIALDSSDNPHISYSSFHYSDPFHYRDIKYATRIGSATTPSPSIPELLLWVVLPLIVIVVLTILIYLRKRARERTTNLESKNQSQYRV